MGRLDLVDLVALHADLGEAIGAAVAEVAAGGRFVLGECVAAFERALAQHLGVPHVVGVGSGSDALVLALRISGVKPGDVVVTTPLSFVASAESILRVGAVPRFIDVDPDTLCLSLDKLQGYLLACSRRGSERLDPETRAPVRAVMPVHLYGRACGIELEHAALEAGLACVHDAAQAVGARQGGVPLGTGAPACLSFFPTKNLGAWGDGGAVLCSDDDLADRVRSLRVHGRDAEGRYRESGLNSRLDAVQAAVLGVKLAVLDRHQARRREQALRYDLAIDKAKLAPRLTPPPPLDAGDVCHLYTVRERSGSREALRAHLEEVGIGSGVYYRRLVCDEPAFAGRALWEEGDLGAARAACAEVLSLPVHPYLPDGAVERVVEAISSFYEG